MREEEKWLKGRVRLFADDRVDVGTVNREKQWGVQPKYENHYDFKTGTAQKKHDEG